jgi:hypothetical protein
MNRVAKVIRNASTYSKLCTLKISDIGNPYWEKREAYFKQVAATVP